MRHAGGAGVPLGAVWLLRPAPHAGGGRTGALCLQAFEASIAARKEAAAAKDAGSGGGDGGLPAGLKLEDPSVLLMPGARDGQTKVVREGGAGVAYAWDAAK